MDWYDTVRVKMKELERIPLRIPGTEQDFVVRMIGISQFDLEGERGIDIAVGLESVNGIGVVSREAGLGHPSELRFHFNLRESKPIDDQCVRLLDFVKLQLVAASRVPPGANWPSRNSTSKLRLALSWVPKLLRKSLVSMAARLKPLRQKGRLRRNVLVSTQGLLVRLATPFPSQVFLGESRNWKGENPRLLISSLCDAVQKNMPSLEGHPAGNSLLVDSFEAVAKELPAFYHNIGGLITAFHYCGFPRWIVLSLPRLFIKVGGSGNRNFFLAWYPVCEFLRSRDGSLAWHEGRTFCEGAIVELVLCDSSLALLTDGVIDVIESGRRKVDLRNPNTYSRVVADVLLQLEDLDRAAERELEARSLLEARQAWLRDSSIGFVEL